MLRHTGTPAHRHIGTSTHRHVNADTQAHTRRQARIGTQAGTHRHAGRERARVRTYHRTNTIRPCPQLQSLAFGRRSKCAAICAASVRWHEQLFPSAMHIIVRLILGLHFITAKYFSSNPPLRQRCCRRRCFCRPPSPRSAIDCRRRCCCRCAKVWIRPPGTSRICHNYLQGKDGNETKR